MECLNELIKFRGDGETHVSTYIQIKDINCIQILKHQFPSVTIILNDSRLFYSRAFNQGHF
jgi:GT2 family glycosyltransferase